MSQEEQKEKAKKMMLEGKLNDEILTVTKLPMNIITRIRGWYNSPYGKMWQENHRAPPAPPPVQVAAAPPLVTTMVQGPTLPDGHQGQPPTIEEHSQFPPRTEGAGAGRSTLTMGLESELLLAGTPLIRKIVLNPKVYFWYDYAKQKLGFKGDIGDFVMDCVEDFWRSRGYKITVDRIETVQVS